MVRKCFRRPTKPVERAHVREIPRRRKRTPRFYYRTLKARARKQHALGTHTNTHIFHPLHLPSITANVTKCEWMQYLCTLSCICEVYGYKHRVAHTKSYLFKWSNMFDRCFSFSELYNMGQTKYNLF